MDASVEDTDIGEGEMDLIGAEKGVDMDIDVSSPFPYGDAAKEDGVGAKEDDEGVNAEGDAAKLDGVGANEEDIGVPY